MLAVNSLAPYVLTCLLPRPDRLVYLNSGLHRAGDASLHDLTWAARPWGGYQAYADSKLHDVLLARSPPLAGGAVQRLGTRLGGHQDGRSRSPRQPGRSP